MKNTSLILNGIVMEDFKQIVELALRDQLERFLIDGKFGPEFKDEILSRKQAAALFGKTPEKISEMYEKKEIPGFKSGREYFFLKSQLIKIFKYKK